jgi:hypothetical protein
MGGGENFPKAGSEASAPIAASLPSGWESSTTPDGRPSFIDHNTHTTTFRLPTDPNLSKDWVAVTVEGDPLPAGWEARRKLNADGEEGSLYFLDHKKKRACWDDPRYRLLEDKEDGNRELPEGWEEQCP